MSELKLPDFVVYYVRRLDFDGSEIARLFEGCPIPLSAFKPGMNIWEESELDGQAWGFRRHVVERVEQEPTRIGVFVRGGSEFWFEKDKPQHKMRFCHDEAKLLELVAKPPSGSTSVTSQESLTPLASRPVRNRGH